MYNKKERKQFKKVDINSKIDNPKTEEELMTNRIKQLGKDVILKKNGAFENLHECLDESLEKGFISEKEYNKHLSMLKNIDIVDETKQKATKMFKFTSDKIKSKINKIKGSIKNDK